MTTIFRFAATSLFAAALFGCNKPAAAPAQASADPAVNDTTATASRTGRVTGIVTAIDATTGKITLDHGPVADLQWPAMTMAFGAKPNMLKGIAVGDKVSFEIVMNGANADIVAIKRR